MSPEMIYSDEGSTQSVSGADTPSVYFMEHGYSFNQLRICSLPRLPGCSAGR